MTRSEHRDEDLLEVPRVPAILKDEDGNESPEGLLPRPVRRYFPGGRA